MAESGGAASCSSTQAPGLMGTDQPSSSATEVDGKQETLTLIGALIESIDSALLQASNRVNDLKDARIQAMKNVVDGLRHKLLVVAEMSLERTLPLAVEANERFGVIDRLSQLSQKVQKLDEAYEIHQTVHCIVQRIGVTSVFNTAISRLQALDRTLAKGSVEPTILEAYQGCVAGLHHVVQRYREEAGIADPNDEDDQYYDASPPMQATHPVANHVAAPEHEPAFKTSAINSASKNRDEGKHLAGEAEGSKDEAPSSAPEASTPIPETHNLKPENPTTLSTSSTLKPTSPPPSSQQRSTGLSMAEVAAEKDAYQQAMLKMVCNV